ncbi:MAG: pyridoxal 5'-phosphate synthase glutaminase subunit PdxT [Microbacteriaceae bacterium]
MAGNTPKRIGVLAFQGDVREHSAVLTSLGAEAIEVRKPEQLNGLDGMIIPGGESSVIDKLSRMFGVFEPLQRKIAEGFPVYGTCAGLIMLSDRVLGAIEGQQSFGGLDITVQRNAFGSQIDSFETMLDAPAVAAEPIRTMFIRGPIVQQTGPDVQILASLSDGTVVAVQQGKLMGTSFHPEIIGETRFHQYFLNLI